jgi:hypothetical protein
MKYSSHTKLITFAGDLAILTYGKTLPEAEAYANSDLATTEKWAWDNKMKFNESKSKAMIITRKRRQNKINVFLDNRRLKQVDIMKHFGNALRQQTLILQAQ